MSRRAMFQWVVTSSILRRRSRVLITVLAVTIGAITLSGLIAIAIDIPAWLAREIRSYGANLVVTPASDVPITDEAVAAATAQAPASTLAGSATFDYETVTISGRPYIADGADLEAAHVMNPCRYVDGEWPAVTGQILVGEQVVSTIDVKARDMITMSQLDTGASLKDVQVQSDAPVSSLKVDPRTAILTMPDIPKIRSNEDGYVYMSRQDMSTLTRQTSAMSLAGYSTALEGNQLSAITDAVGAASFDVHAQTARHLAQSNTGVLAILRSLLIVTTVIVPALTTIGMSTIIIAIVTEYRDEIGLCRTLGVTARPVTREFIGEGIILDLIEGLLGAGAGYGLAVLISASVFHRSISLHSVILLSTVACSILIIVSACLPPMRRALAVDPAFVLRGE